MPLLWAARCNHVLLLRYLSPIGGGADIEEAFYYAIDEHSWRFAITLVTLNTIDFRQWDLPPPLCTKLPSKYSK